MMDKFTSEKLNNNMDTYFICLPNTHSTVISFYIRAGIKYEDKQHTGVSHLIEHLLFRRLHDMDQKQLYYEMECIGATLRAATYADFIRYYIEVLPEYTLQAFELVYKIMLGSDWTAEDIRKEKAVVINQIDESSYTYDDENRLVYWYGTLLSYLNMGTPSKVRKLSLKTVSHYYNRFFQPQNSAFVLTGNFDEQIKEHICQKLNLLKNKNELILSSKPIYPQNFCRRSAPCDDYIYDTDGEYANVRICFEVNYNHVKREEGAYLHSILGDGLGSRLSLPLRDELGLVDEIYSVFEHHNGFSILGINYDVVWDKLLESLDQVFSAVISMKEHISERDINASIVFLTKNWAFDYDSPEVLNFYYGWHSHILGDSFESPEAIYGKFYQMSTIDLQDAAAKLFTSGNMSSFVYCNKDYLRLSGIQKHLEKWRKNL